MELNVRNMRSLKMLKLLMMLRMFIMFNVLFPSLPLLFLLVLTLIFLNLPDSLAILMNYLFSSSSYVNSFEIILTHFLLPSLNSCMQTASF